MLGGKILDQQTDPQPPPVNPAQKVAESISYKDAPPSIQRQIEAQAGMRPASDAEAKAHEATQKPKPPSNPAPAKAAAK
jgi:hypothetical protein